MTTRVQIVAEARSWIGTRWQHQARVKGVATDCIGLVGGVALALSLSGAEEWAADPTLHCYGRTPSPDLIITTCDRLMDRVPLGSIKIGDVLIMSFEEEPQHFGIVSRTEPIYVVHAYASAKRVVENGVGMSKVRVKRAYSFRGLA